MAAAVVVAVAAACGADKEPAPGMGGPEPGAQAHAAPVADATPEGWVSVNGPGVTLAHPTKWRALAPSRDVIVPRELLALAASPAPSSGARCDSEDAVIRLFERRPLRGDVWAGLDKADFPPRPGQFALAGDAFERTSCPSGFRFVTRFRAADRPLWFSVFSRTRPSDARLAELAAIMNTLRVTELPPRPPDPYAGWPALATNPGDSLHPPPGWPAAASSFSPENTPRPRTLFFTSNRALDALPARLTTKMTPLPAAPPEAAIAGFARDAVLVWVREEPVGAEGAFPQIRPEWPAREDFQPSASPGGEAPGVRWLRAGGSWMGYRFSVWIAPGPDADGADLALAFKSAASLAVAGGCSRESVTEEC